MREDRNQASVRIEIDGDASAPSNVPAVAPAGRSGFPLIGGIVALGLVALLVVLALPEQEEDGFVGGPEATTDSLPSSSTTTEAPPRTDQNLPSTTLGPDEAPGVRDTNLGSEVQSIAPAGRGWIALRRTNGSGVPPRLMRSVDGTDWTAIETSFDVPEVDSSYAEYSNLTATDTGFAMLMSSFGERPGPEGESTVIVHRLVSEFGVEWEVDPDFSPWKGTGAYAQPISHVGEWVQMVLWRTPDPTGSPVGQVLRDTVIDPDALGDACWAYSSGVSELTVENCQQPGGSVRLDAEDFIEPERFGEVRNCVNELMEGGPMPGTFDFATIGLGSVRAIDDVSVLVSAPTLLPDGTIVLLDGGSELFEIGACADLVDIELRAGSRLVVWPAGAAEPTHIPVELDATPDFFFFAVGAVAPVPDGLRIVFGNEVWEADLTNGTMELLLETSEPGFTFSTGMSVLTPDGDRLVSFGSAPTGAQIVVHDLETGERTVLADELRTVDWVEPAHVTNDEVFVQLYGVRSRTVWIDLTPQ